MRIELFDEIEVMSNGQKVGEKLDIESVSDIYMYKERILNIINEYIEVKDKK